MNATDFVLSSTKTGDRIHRADCKRIPASAQNVPLDKVLGFAPGTAAQAKAAACCKPKIDEVLAEARAALAAAPVAASPDRKHFRPDLEDRSGDSECQYPVYDVKRYVKWPHMGPCGHVEPHTHEDHPADRRGDLDPTTPTDTTDTQEDEMPDATTETHTVSLDYRTHGGPRRYWMGYMKGGEALAAKIGVTAKRDRATDSLLITGTPQTATDAAETIGHAWLAANREVKGWRGASFSEGTPKEQLHAALESIQAAIVESVDPADSLI